MLLHTLMIYLQISWGPVMSSYIEKLHCYCLALTNMLKCVHSQIFQLARGRCRNIEKKRPFLRMNESCTEPEYLTTRLVTVKQRMCL